jgi:hypothetical protein
MLSNSINGFGGDPASASHSPTVRRSGVPSLRRISVTQIVTRPSAADLHLSCSRARPASPLGALRSAIDPGLYQLAKQGLAAEGRLATFARLPAPSHKIIVGEMIVKQGATITATRWRIRSATSSGIRSSRAPAQRNSIATLRRGLPD